MKIQNDVRTWQKLFQRKIKVLVYSDTLRGTPHDFNEWFKQSHSNEALMLAMLKTIHDKKTLTEQLERIQTKLLTLENEHSSLYSGAVHHRTTCNFQKQDVSSTSSRLTVKVTPTKDKFFDKK